MHPNSYWRIVLLLCVVVPSFADAATLRQPLASGRVVAFLEGEEAKSAITEDTHDPFFRRLTVLDRELRLAEPLREVTLQQQDAMIRKLFRDAVTAWPAAQRQQVLQVCQELETRMDRICPTFAPREWRFVRTDGTEEAHAAYTRHDTIILPAAKLGDHDAAELARLIAHETAHVFSRLHPQPRAQLYARLGFQEAAPMELGEWLEKHRITNPDGQSFEYVLRVEHPQYGPTDATLVTYSPFAEFSPQQGRSLFRYLRSGLALVEKSDTGYRVRLDPQGVAVIAETGEVRGFFEQIGRNTEYVIHPDEILAENLALLFAQGWPGHAPLPVPDQKLVQDLANILRDGCPQGLRD